MRQPLHSVAAARAIEAAAIQAGIPGYTLMRRAGQAAFKALRRHWPEARRILVLCGPGNNGGDGLVLARLARAAGLSVTVLAVDELKPAGEAAEALADWHIDGGWVAVWRPGEPLPAADLLVDALLGIGLSRAPEGALAALIEAANAHPAPRFALDVPSGVEADTGAVPGAAIRASRTLAFIVQKRGLSTGAALDHAGTLELAGLELPHDLLQAQPACADWLGWPAEPSLPPRARDAHKGLYGHVLVLGGERGMGGAARLCAEAALRCGAGLVSVGTRGMHVPALLAARPECMVAELESGEDLPPLLERATVVAIGPGLGQGDWGRALWHAVARLDRPRVVDADALNLIAAGVTPQGELVLTPHPGEAARLLGCASADVQRDRFAAAGELARRHAAVAVLKGAGSVVAAPDGRCVAIAGGNPGMASGGMGDVLAGVIAGLWAQGLSAFDAAVAGAALHAAAGDAAAADGGERGLLAGDLFAPLRRLLAERA